MRHKISVAVLLTIFGLFGEKNLMAEDPSNKALAEAKKSFEKGDYDKAIIDFTEALKIDPKDYRIYFGRGYSWQVKREHEKAIDDFSEALKINPKDSQSFFYRGYSWHAMKEYDKAIADYNESLRLKPNNSQVYAGRGYSRIAKGEYDKAIADYNEALKLDPKDSQAYFYRGCAWFTKGEYDKAVADLRATLRVDPKSLQANNNLAWLLATCVDEKYRDGKQAVEYSTKACELSNWTNADCLLILAAAYAETGNFAEAVKWQQKALEISPASAKEMRTSRLELYKSGKPYRDDLKKSTTN